MKQARSFARATGGVRPSLILILATLLALAGCSLETAGPAGNSGAGPPLPVSFATPPVAMYRANPQRTGEYPGPAVRTLHGLLWSKTLGAQVTPIVSPPVVAAGVVYLLTSDGYLHALDVQDGTQRWTIRAYELSPLVAESTVYYGWKASLYALNAQTKQTVWQFPVEVDLAGPPAIVSDTVYLASVRGDFYAVDANTGRERWRARGGDGIAADLAVQGTNVYFIGQDRTSPAAADYVQVQGHVYALDSTSGQQRWRYAPHDSIESLTAADGRIYAVRLPYASLDASASPSPWYLDALDGVTGKELWTIPLGGSTDRVPPPAAAAGMLYVSGNIGVLYALDAASGKEVWRFPAGGYLGTASVADGTLYVGTEDAYLHALDAKTGQELWKWQAQAAITAPAAIAGGVVYFHDSTTAYAIH